jgi:hypothetical protein
VTVSNQLVLVSKFRKVIFYKTILFCKRCFIDLRILTNAERSLSHYKNNVKAYTSVEPAQVIIEKGTYGNKIILL